MKKFEFLIESGKNFIKKELRNIKLNGTLYTPGLHCEINLKIHNLSITKWELNTRGSLLFFPTF